MFFIIILFIFAINTFIEYTQYKHFKTNEIYQTDAIVINRYPKEKYIVLKLQTKNFTFFTTVDKSLILDKFQNINIYLVTKEITFLSYLKGFFSNSFNITPNEKKKLFKESFYQTIENQHNSKAIASLYSALFLATPLDQEIRLLASNLGISHLIAISGFHLGLMSLVLYFLLHILYNKLHKKFTPHRNKRFDIMICISIILFSYLIFLDLPASLLRAFVMFVFALFLLRNNIKLISFETLFIISIFIISLFPKLLFSLSLWFSISGVFYIFLFLNYFKKLNKYVQLLLFNFWIYFAMNPIVHYFFPTTTIEQLFSPILTILFSLFYPLSILLHLLGYGDFLDWIIQYLMNLDIKDTEVFTPLWVFLSYICLSLLAISKKIFFVLLNIAIIVYTIWLFQSTFKEYLFIGI